MNKIFALLATTILIYSCGSDKKEFENAGGSLKIALDSAPSTLIATDITDVYSQTVVSQVTEGLVSFNPDDLTLQPQLAEKWKMSQDGKTFTFTLRKDIYFHEHEVFGSDDDRLLVPEDVLATVEFSCKKNDKGEARPTYLALWKDQLLGANEFFSGKAKSIKGLKIKGNDIEFTLTESDPTFAEKLAQVNAGIVAKEIIDAKKEHELNGTGPFKFAESTNNEQERIVLTKNEDYYLIDEKGNALPYLDSVIFIVETRKLEQLDLFENKQIDVIRGLPISRISEMLDGHIDEFNAVPPTMVLYNNPLLNTQFYFFNLSDKRFQDPRVRMAFNYAVDKNQIAENTLNNQYYEMGRYGIVPPISSNFNGYDFKKVGENGYNFDPEKAKALLAEAGFPNGEGFGSVNLRIDIKDINSAVAEEFANQIKMHLNINVNIDGSDFQAKNDDANYAKGDLFRSSWTADYNSPETFLSNFYGKFVPKSIDLPSNINQSRYVNPAFDALYEKARAAQSQKERYKTFVEAEVELLKNPPFIPLWYSNNFQLVYSNVRNLKLNPMDLINLTRVYKKDWTKEEYLKAKK
jgi:ABC-type transport system substrate-binding protein